MSEENSDWSDAKLLSRKSQSRAPKWEAWELPNYIQFKRITQGNLILLCYYHENQNTKTLCSNFAKCMDDPYKTTEWNKDMNKPIH